jgi:hypothetical protein
MPRTTTKMGLTTWNLEDDDYDSQQLANNWQLVDFHDHTIGRGVPIPAGGLGAGSVLQQNIAAGVISGQHLGSALSQDLGIGVNGRGYTGIPAPQSVTTTNYSFAPTQDVVSNLVVAAGGMIEVTYQALWKISSGAGYAIIVINGSPAPIATANGAPSSVFAQVGMTGNDLSPLWTGGSGLVTLNSTNSNSTEVSNGQILGGYNTASAVPIPVRIFFNTAGTYSVGVQFLVGTSGQTVTVQNRHLWARAVNFV